MLCTHLIGWIARVHKQTQSLPLILAAKDGPFDSAFLCVPKRKALTTDMALSESLERELDLPLLILVRGRPPD